MQGAVFFSRHGFASRLRRDFIEFQRLKGVIQRAPQVPHLFFQPLHMSLADRKTLFQRGVPLFHKGHEMPDFPNLHSRLLEAFDELDGIQILL